VAKDLRKGAMVNPHLSEDLKEKALNQCKAIAGSHRVVAACLYGPRACGYAKEESDINILLIVDEHPMRLWGYLKPLGEISAFILTVDQRIFEKDVEQGWLGEFMAQNISVPYIPLINGEYLWHQELKLKRRIIWEILENLLLEFPELSNELLIEAEYFAYDAMMRKARLFPPMAYGFLNMLREDLKEKNLGSMMMGYSEALKANIEEGWIAPSNRYFKITQKFSGAVKRRRLPVPVPVSLKAIRRATSINVLSFFPKMMRPFVQDQELFEKSHPDIKAEGLISRLGDPKKHLFVSTPFGLVPLSDKTTIEDFVRKAVPGGGILDMKIEEMGGVLNAVYLLTLLGNQGEQRVVIKKFRDWRGFKWFPLTLWTLGTRSFAVLGRSRLEREYAINQYLRNQGFPVPKVLYVCLQGHLIFEEFIEGENLAETVKRILSKEQEYEEEASLIREVGREIAMAHGLGVALGDCKPENFIVGKDGKTYFLDLEQATRDGNQAWDIAEFLYYSGHYAPPLSSADATEFMATQFIQGYLDAGGKTETVKKAGSVQYAKVFSILTQPHIILAISNLCKKLGRKDDV